jgi:hypothetical protein
MDMIRTWLVGSLSKTKDKNRVDGSSTHSLVGMLDRDVASNFFLQSRDCQIRGQWMDVTFTGRKSIAQIELAGSECRLDPNLGTSKLSIFWECPIGCNVYIMTMFEEEEEESGISRGY